MKLDLQEVFMTSGICQMIEDGDITYPFVAECLQRHSNGDWGNVCKDDAELNNAALEDEYKPRILSAYSVPESDTKLWVITDAGHVITTVLLPSEY